MPVEILGFDGVPDAGEHFHVVENERALAKAGDDPKKRRRVVRKQPPEGFVGYVVDRLGVLVMEQLHYADEVRATTEVPVQSGDVKPNELALAKRLTLSRPTTRRAIQELVDKGLLVRKRGVGTQVVQNPVHRI